MDNIFEKSLTEQNIDFNRYMTAPTIFNNVLWSCTAEGDTAYYQGLYSFWDTEEKVSDLKVIPKNHHLIDKYNGTREAETLKWFSNEYYGVQDLGGDSLQFNDLRYGSMSEREDDYVFYFILKENEEGILEVREPRERDIEEGMLDEFWERIKGK